MKFIKKIKKIIEFEKKEPESLPTVGICKGCRHYSLIEGEAQRLGIFFGTKIISFENHVCSLGLKIDFGMHGEYITKCNMFKE